ncbi:MAG: hypothetical protein K8S21_01635 [Gemmatimonadetes bacterium]|nr:hypothetical protein [Gemmatimonadota bacterium]
MNRPTVLVLAIVAVAACGPKGQQAGQGAADSTSIGNAFTDSANARDSIGPAVPADSVAAPAGGAYIGRDSAFGPTFTVDSTGKVTPIVPPKKKP